MASDLSIVILAAGKGTRLRSGLAKVLHRAGGLPLVEHVVRACRPLGARRIVVVVGHQADDVRRAVEPLGVETVLQQPQLGTGHALLVARRALAGAKAALVLPGDAPLVRTHTLQGLVRAWRSSQPAAMLLSAVLDDPAGYGRILRKRDGSVAAIVEEKALDEETRAVREVNSSIYVFTLAKLWPALAQVKPENVHKEIYLTDAVAVLDRSGERILAEVAADGHEVLGCNTRAELAEVDRVFRQRKRAALMAAGATIYLPETVLADPDVTVGPDTVIEPGVQLLGTTRVGAKCTIKTGSVLVNTVVEDGATIKQNCLIASSRIGPGCQVGPFAHLRDGAELKFGARVGNFVEVKKSRLDPGVKAMHLTYLGDAAIGAGTNVGAGTITCNYDGTKKNATRIGRKVFVGSGTELVAPVRVGDGAYIAAGSTVTENVPPGALALARARQVNKPGWVAARRREAASPAKKKPAPRKRSRAKRRARKPSRRPARQRKPKRAARRRIPRRQPSKARRKSRR
jgi:bifunctional UDP-N-acetylglucosamine pyrophosphorylase/glucosamine-1-phosphate N-acetyltransferase